MAVPQHTGVGLSIKKYVINLLSKNLQIFLLQLIVLYNDPFMD